LNDPVSVDPEAKQLEEVVKVRLLPLTTDPVLCSDVVKANAGDPSGLVSDAVQFPLMLFLSELDPHPASMSPAHRMNAIPSCFMSISLISTNPNMNPNEQ
jgi:hypothetical protein